MDITPMLREVARKIVEHCCCSYTWSYFQYFLRVRMNRQWGGIVDVCPDACPIISPTKVEGFVL